MKQNQILINGVMPRVEITNIHWGIADLDGQAGTFTSDTTGETERDRIGRKRLLTIDIGPSSAADVSHMLKLVKPQWVEITYYDWEDLGWRTDLFYVANRGVQSLPCSGNLIPDVTTDFSNLKSAATSMEFVGKGNPEEGDD